LEEQIRKMKVLPNLRTLETIFTPGQIRLLLNPSKRNIRWNADDIASAISLRSVSPKAYHYLRNHNFSLAGLCYDQKLASDSTGLSGGFSGQRAWVRIWAPGNLFELVQTCPAARTSAQYSFIRRRQEK
jgi:hypothetical protein